MTTVEPATAENPAPVKITAAAPQASPADGAENESDSEDERICRVCRCDDADEPLFSPCLCRGSISYVHQECLLQWLQVSGKKACELCAYPYRFSPLYSPDKPQRLTLIEFVQIACWKFLQEIPLITRYVFVSAVWLVAVPFCTCWIFRLWMMRSTLGLAEDDTYFRFDILKSDLLAGIFICLVGFVVALALFSFIDIVMSVREQQALHERERRLEMLNEFAADGDDDADLIPHVDEQRPEQAERDRNVNVGDDTPQPGGHDQPETRDVARARTIAVPTNAQPDGRAAEAEARRIMEARDRQLAEQLQAEDDAEQMRLLFGLPPRHHETVNQFGNTRNNHARVHEEDPGVVLAEGAVAAADNTRARNHSNRAHRHPLVEGTDGASPSAPPSSSCHSGASLRAVAQSHNVSAAAGGDEQMKASDTLQEASYCSGGGPGEAAAAHADSADERLGAIDAEKDSHDNDGYNDDEGHDDEGHDDEGHNDDGHDSDGHDDDGHDGAGHDGAGHGGIEEVEEVEDEVADDHGGGGAVGAGVIGGHILDADLEFQLDGHDILGFRGPILNLICNVAVTLGLMAICLGIAVRMPISFSQFMLSSGLWATHQLFPALLNYTDDMANNALWWLHNNDSAVAVRPDDTIHSLLGWFMAVLLLAGTDLLLSAAHRAYGGQFWLYDVLHAGLDPVLSVFKLGTILVLKMIIFPLIFGLCLSACTAPLFTFTADDLHALFMESPLNFALLQWVVGVSYMLLVTFCLLELRSVLHPEVLADIIRLPDPEQQMMKNLLLERVDKIAQRMCISTVVYMIPLVFFIHAPIQATIWLKKTLSAEGVFEPLHLQLHYVYFGVQLPLELALLHVAFLHIIENAKGPIRRLQAGWLKAVCAALGLDRWLLPRPVEPGAVAAEEVKRGAAAAASVTAAAPNAEEATPSSVPATNENPAAAPLPLVNRARHEEPAAEREPAEREPADADVVEQAEEATIPLLPREAPKTWFVARIATFYVLAWLSTLVVFIILVWSIFSTGRFLFHTTARISDPDGGHDVISLLVGGVVAHCVLHGLYPAQHALRLAWRARLSNNGYAPAERQEKTTFLGIAVARTVGEYFAASVLCPLLLGHIGARLIFSENQASFDSVANGTLVSALHPALAVAVACSDTDGPEGPSGFDVLLQTGWCVFQDWMLGVVLTAALFVSHLLYPLIFPPPRRPENRGVDGAAWNANEAGGAGVADGEVIARPLQRNGAAVAAADGVDVPPPHHQAADAERVVPAVNRPAVGPVDDSLVFAGVSTKYFFSLYSPVFVWAATVAVHAAAVAALAWVATTLEWDIAPSLVAIADVHSLRWVAAFWVLQRLVVANWATLAGCVHGVHDKLMEERYRVGWQLHNLEAAADATAC